MYENELQGLIKNYLHDVKLFALSGANENILERKTNQKFWRESLQFWKNKINIYLQKEIK